MKDHAENTYPDGQMDILYGKDLLKAQKVANKVYVKVISRNEQTAYTDFTSRIKNMEEMAGFAKSTLNTGSRFELGNLKNPDGTITNNHKETINTLFNHYFPGSEEINNNSNISLDPQSPVEITIDENNRLFTYSKVLRAFKSFRNYKSPGPDGIQLILSKNLDPKTLDRIAHIYKACYKLEYTPNAFEESKSSFIPKPNKEDYQNPKSWRPITLLNFLP